MKKKTTISTLDQFFNISDLPKQTISPAPKKVKLTPQEMASEMTKDLVISGDELNDCEFLARVINDLIEVLSYYGVRVSDLVIDGFSTDICYYYKCIEEENKKCEQLNEY